MAFNNDSDVAKLAYNHFLNQDYKGIITTAFPMQTRTLSFSELIKISGADVLAIRLQKQIARCENQADKVKLDNLYKALFNDRSLWDIYGVDEKDKESVLVNAHDYKFIAIDAPSVLGSAFGKALLIIESYLDGFDLNNLSGTNTEVVEKKLKEAGIDVTTKDSINIGNVAFDDEKMNISFNINYSKLLIANNPSDEHDMVSRVLVGINPIAITVTVPIMNTVLDYPHKILGPKKGDAIFDVYLGNMITINKGELNGMSDEDINKCIDVKKASDFLSKSINTAKDVFNQKLYSISCHCTEWADDTCRVCSNCVKLGHSECNPYIYESSDKTQDDINEIVTERFNIRNWSSRRNDNKMRPNEGGIEWVSEHTENTNFMLLAEKHADFFDILSTPHFPFLKQAVIHTQMKIAEDVEYIQELIATAMAEEEKLADKEKTTKETETEEKKEEIVEEKKDDVNPVLFDPDTPDEYE